MDKRKYGSSENAKVKSPTGNEFNEGSMKFNALIKKRMAKQKNAKHSKSDLAAAHKHMKEHAK
jgi:hypothetical protein